MGLYSFQYARCLPLPGSTVSVYASKEGYENSDTVTKVITIGGNSGEGSGVFGDVNGDGVVNAADIVQIANIIMGK